MKLAFVHKNYDMAYKVLVTIIAAFFILSGYWEITKNINTYPKTIQMGYPPYFITSLGIAKIAGAIILLLPKLRKLKEWTFAGFTFDVVFAFISGLATNLPADCIKSSIAFIMLGITYFLFTKIQTDVRQTANANVIS